MTLVLEPLKILGYVHRSPYVLIPNVPPYSLFRIVIILIMGWLKKNSESLDPFFQIVH